MNIKNQTLFNRNHKITDRFSPAESTVVYHGDCLELLKFVPDEALQLIVTSPPYNIGKEYEKKLNLNLYIEQQAKVINECVRALGLRI
jgi:DNA modification methylase